MGFDETKESVRILLVVASEIEARLERGAALSRTLAKRAAFTLV